jgi:hypothetical protein
MFIAHPDNVYHSVCVDSYIIFPGLISVDAVKKLLEVSQRGKKALWCTEIMTSHFYKGNNRAMLLPNALFRMGGAALLLSTSKSKSQFRLMHSARTQLRHVKNGDVQISD